MASALASSPLVNAGATDARYVNGYLVQDAFVEAKVREIAAIYAGTKTAYEVGGEVKYLGAGEYSELEHPEALMKALTEMDKLGNPDKKIDTGEIHIFEKELMRLNQ